MRTFSIFSRIAFVAAAMVGTSAGCFDAELDPSQSGLYTCNNASDCAFATAMVCLLGKCVTQGEGPELLEIQPADGTKLPPQAARNLEIRVTARNLALGAQVEATNGGLLKVFVDGRQVGVATAGDVAVGVVIRLPTDFQLLPGLHHILVKAFRDEMTPYPNAAAEKAVSFWIDDGEPHVGILEPHPGTAVRVGESIVVKAGAINFRYLNSKIEPPPDAPEPTGHLHLFLNRPIPDCLSATPNCGGQYLMLLEPEGAAATDIVESRAFEVPLSQAKGEISIAIVAQDRMHQSFPSNDPNEVVYNVVSIKVDAKM